MLVMPSVDILGGKCVRLTEGKLGSEETFFDDPLQAALYWEMEGADALHVVDLDGALRRGENLRHVERIIKSVSIDVEVGGGIRSADTAVKVYLMGAERVILGSLAVRDPVSLEKIIDEIGEEHVMVALDYKEGEVMVEGWREGARKRVYDAAREMKDIGVKWILATNVARDGTLKGADTETISRLVRYVGVNIVASGGIRSISDVAKLRKVGAKGVVIGRALYMGLFSLKEAKEAAGEC